VLFQQITGTDPRTLGANETAAAQLGITAQLATQLQQVAPPRARPGQPWAAASMIDYAN